MVSSLKKKREREMMVDVAESKGRDAFQTLAVYFRDGFNRSWWMRLAKRVNKMMKLRASTEHHWAVTSSHHGASVNYST